MIIVCCQACAASCSHVSSVGKRRAWSFLRPLRSPATSANEPFSRTKRMRTAELPGPGVARLMCLQFSKNRPSRPVSPRKGRSRLNYAHSTSSHRPATGTQFRQNCAQRRVSGQKRRSCLNYEPLPAPTTRKGGCDAPTARVRRTRIRLINESSDPPKRFSRGRPQDPARGRTSAWRR